MEFTGKKVIVTGANGLVGLPAVKKCLDEMGYSGWLVIERSRDAKKPSDTKYNYGANTAYLKSIFQ